MQPNDLQREGTLDDIDRRIVHSLQTDSRMTNAELAARAGIAPSTCLARVRGLVTRGVITRFAAAIDPHALGYELQVLVSVTVRSGARSHISELSAELRQHPEVLQLFFLGGVEDFMLHLAVRDSAHVRDFVVEHLSSHPAISATRTSIVFEHHEQPVSV